MNIEQLEDEVKKLRSFAKRCVARDEWCDIDGGELQDLAEAYGIIEAYSPPERCGDNCACADSFLPEEFKNGDVKCFRLTAKIAAAE